MTPRSRPNPPTARGGPVPQSSNAEPPASKPPPTGTLQGGSPGQGRGHRPPPLRESRWEAHVGNAAPGCELEDASGAPAGDRASVPEPWGQAAGPVVRGSRPATPRPPRARAKTLLLPKRRQDIILPVLPPTNTQTHTHARPRHMHRALRPSRRKSQQRRQASGGAQGDLLIYRAEQACAPAALQIVDEQHPNNTKGLCQASPVCFQCLKPFTHAQEASRVTTTAKTSIPGGISLPTLSLPTPHLLAPLLSIRMPN